MAITATAPATTTVSRRGRPHLLPPRGGRSDSAGATGSRGFGVRQAWFRHWSYHMELHSNSAFSVRCEKLVLLRREDVTSAWHWVKMYS